MRATSLKIKTIQELSQNLKVDLEEIISKYPTEDFVGRLTKQMAEDSLKEELSPELESILNKVCDLPFLKDKRTPVDYGLDLIYGWLMEDVAIEFLTKNGLEVEKTGVDAGRVFLKDFEITTNSDLVISGHHFDVYFDSGNLWQEQNGMDVRESKWNSLRAVNGSILCFSRAGIGMVHTFQHNDFGIWENPAWGFKRAVSVNDMRDRLVPPVIFLMLLEMFLSLPESKRLGGETQWKIYET
jgi:hypothetical protein